MPEVFPIAIAVLTWWGATLLLLRLTLHSRPRRVGALVAVSVLAVVGVVLLATSLSKPTAGGAYAGFVGAILIWGWFEATYFLGWLTGPRPAACPQGVSGWQRFRHGLRASLWHELAIAATGVGILAWSVGAVNPVGAWTFCVLWGMRWSVKLNIFFGVSNLHREFWPEHLQYLGSYARQQRMNPVFPISMTVGVTCGLLLWHVATSAPPGGAVSTGALLVATLLALGLLEHILLMLPVPDAWLWRLAGAPDSSLARHGAVTSKLKVGTES